MVRANIFNGLVHDLLHLGDYENPLPFNPMSNKLVVDLLNSKITPLSDDDFNSFYGEKIKWFNSFLKKNKINKKEIDKAVIRVWGGKEDVEIIFRGKKFSKSRVL